MTDPCWALLDLSKLLILFSFLVWTRWLWRSLPQVSSFFFTGTSSSGSLDSWCLASTQTSVACINASAPFKASLRLVMFFLTRSNVKLHGHHPLIKASKARLALRYWIYKASRLNLLRKLRKSFFGPWMTFPKCMLVFYSYQFATKWLVNK